MRINSLHERIIACAPESIGRLLDTLSSPGDKLWPYEKWPSQRFNKPLSVGASGGHGPIRYKVEEYQPGRLVRYKFNPSCGFSGFHWFEITPNDRGTLIRHVIQGQAGFTGWMKWHLAIRSLHDALIEDAFDKAERLTSGLKRKPARWSFYVRFLRWIFSRANRK